MTTRLVVLLAPAILAAVLWSAAAPGARAQPQPPCGPCPCTFDRTVLPHEIAVNESVHVTIDLDCRCPEDTQKGVDVFFVVDRTSTMFDTGYMAPTKLALTSFVNAMDFTKGAAGLITYALNDHVASNLTTDRERILYQISVIRRDEETDVRGLQSAFRTATQKLDNDGTPGNDKVIIIIAAGADIEGANINMPTVTQASRNAGIRAIFLMFPDARYPHYVAAASECLGPPCPNWSGVGYRWAWPVTDQDIGTHLGTLLPGLLLKAPAIDSYEIYEAMGSGSVYDASSSMPPHSRRPSTQDVYWDYKAPAIPAAGVHIEYDAEMIYADTTYTVTDISLAKAKLTDNMVCEIPLPNPPITVRGAITPSPTGPATSTPTPSATPTLEASPTPTGGGPGDTPTPHLPFAVFLPIALDSQEL